MVCFIAWYHRWKRTSFLQNKGENMVYASKYPLTIISLMRFAGVQHQAQSLHCLGTGKWFGNQFLYLYYFADLMKDNLDVRCAPVSFMDAQETSSSCQLCLQGVPASYSLPWDK